jgi:hypothetical protein
VEGAGGDILAGVLMPEPCCRFLSSIRMKPARRQGCPGRDQRDRSEGRAGAIGTFLISFLWIPLEVVSCTVLLPNVVVALALAAILLVSVSIAIDQSALIASLC